MDSTLEVRVEQRAQGAETLIQRCMPRLGTEWIEASKEEERTNQLPCACFFFTGCQGDKNALARCHHGMRAALVYIKSL